MNFIKSSTKQILSFPFHTSAISLASIYCTKSLEWMGLRGPFATLANHLRPLATPLIKSVNLINQFMRQVIPSIRVDLTDPIPGVCVPVGPRRYGCDLSTIVAIAPISEELVFREILQKRLLPKIASYLPFSLRQVLQHKMARIALTSLLFAASHETAPLFHFSTSCLYGVVAETSSLLSTAHHSAFNLYTLFASAHPSMYPPST